MRDRPSDLGLRPFGDEGTEPLPAPPPNTAPIMAAAFGALRDAAKTKVFWILFATFFICGASTNGLVQVHLIPMCLDFGIPQVQRRRPARRHGHLRFRRHHRVGLAVGPLRQSLAAVLVLRPARAVAAVPAVHRLLVLRHCRCSRCSMASTGSRRCRRRCGSPRSGSGRSAPIWCSAGFLPAISSAPASPRFGAGLSRTVLESYLPAFFVAGALCIVRRADHFGDRAPVKVAAA